MVALPFHNLGYICCLILSCFDLNPGSGSESIQTDCVLRRLFAPSEQQAGTWRCFFLQSLGILWKWYHAWHIRTLFRIPEVSKQWRILSQKSFEINWVYNVHFNSFRYFLEGCYTINLWLVGKMFFFMCFPHLGKALVDANWSRLPSAPPLPIPGVFETLLRGGHVTKDFTNVSRWNPWSTWKNGWRWWEWYDFLK